MRNRVSESVRQDDKELVRRVQDAHDPDAFTELLRRYQGSAYGCAYHHLGEFEAARDAAQEAFVRAYGRIGTLREPERFAVWLRGIVVNECRMYRRRARTLPVVPLSDALAPVLPDDADRRAERLALRQALSCLTTSTREAVTLFYLDGYSLTEIAAFLGVPASAVKSRLRDARARLRKELREMIEETMRVNPLPPTFAAEVVKRLFRAIEERNQTTLQTMLSDDGRLVFARNPPPENIPLKMRSQAPLVMAVSHNNREAVTELVRRGALQGLAAEDAQEMLYGACFHRNQEHAALALRHGGERDIFCAALLGDADAVRRMLATDPGLVHARGPQGETPLHDAASVGVARVLLEHGADIEAVDTTYGNTPLEFGFRDWAAEYLIERGAHVSFHQACWRNDVEGAGAYLDADPALLQTPLARGKRPGSKYPVSLAAEGRSLEVLGLLLDRGANPSFSDPLYAGYTPLHFAAERGYVDVVRLLLERGADPNPPGGGGGISPVARARAARAEHWQAIVGIAEHEKVIDILARAGAA
jgi:RNA polymerase sigma factor (sigma-70 family)